VHRAPSSSGFGVLALAASSNPAMHGQNADKYPARLSVASSIILPCTSQMATYTFPAILENTLVHASVTCDVQLYAILTQRARQCDV